MLNVAMTIGRKFDGRLKVGRTVHNFLYEEKS